jgi:hypothetical protein
MKRALCLNSQYSRPGLPDGMYMFKPKIPIRVIFEGRKIENIDILYVHLEYITDIWYILWPFGIFLAVWQLT